MNEQEKLSRKTIPQLKPFSDLTTAETSSCGKSEFETSLYDRHSKHAKALYYEWRAKPTIENALSVVNAASFLTDRNLFVGPAKQVLNTPQIRSLAKMSAEFVLGGQSDIKFQSTNTEAIPQVIDLKIKTRHNPHNPHYWAELGRVYTFLGEKQKASRAFKVALDLSPDDRFTLRSFCRFSVHAGNATHEDHELSEIQEFARQTLIRSGRCEFDPWIQSAEIALSDHLAMPVFSAKKAIQTINRGNHADFALSELYSALGTLESVNGSHKKGQRLIKSSLQDPTASALAQATWLQSERLIKISADTRLLGLGAAYEASAYKAAADKNWEHALFSFFKWLYAEPFSASAAIQGSYLATSVLFEPKSAIEFCETGLKYNPRSVMLRNNYVVALCFISERTQAKAQMNRLKRDYPDWKNSVTYCATNGIVCFSDGDNEQGREWYLRAIELSDKDHDNDTRFRARLHWVFEEHRHGLIDRKTLNEITEILDRHVSRMNLPGSTVAFWNKVRAEFMESDSIGITSTLPIWKNRNGLSVIEALETDDS